MGGSALLDGHGPRRRTDLGDVFFAASTSLFGWVSSAFPTYLIVMSIAYLVRAVGR